MNARGLSSLSGSLSLRERAGVRARGLYHRTAFSTAARPHPGPLPKGEGERN